MPRRFHEDDVFVPGLKISVDVGSGFEHLSTPALIDVTYPTSDMRILNLEPGELSGQLATPLFTGERDSDELDRETQSLRKFMAKLSFLPTLEWGGLVLFWYLGSWDWSRCAYMIMIILLVVVVGFKFYILRELQEGSFKLHETIERVLKGEVGGVAASAMKKVFGKMASLPLVLYSMPSFLEGATTVFALPGTLSTFQEFPEMNERWYASWGGWVPFSLPSALLGITFIALVSHAILFYVFLFKAYQHVQTIGRAEYEVVKKNGFKAPPGILKARLADAVSRSAVWYSCGESASQANLMVVSQVGNTFVKDVYGKLGEIPSTSRGLYRVDPWPNGGKRPIYEQPLQRSVLGSPSRTLFRVCLNTGVRLWIKISILADGFDNLQDEGRSKLVVAIMMGLLSMAFTVPDQIEGLDSGGNFAMVKLPVFILTFSLFLMLTFRLFAVYVVCETTHIFNFSSMSCYDESASMLQKAGMGIVLVTTCCCCNFFAVRSSVGRVLRRSMEGM